MSATTVNQKYVANGTLPREFGQMVRRQVFGKAGAPDGRLFAINHTTESVATTSLDEADDEVFFFTFGPDTYLVSLLIDFADHDSGTDLVFDVIAEDSAGTEVVLINDSAAGQTGAVDELDAGLAFTEVSNMKLGIKIVTPAATAVAGTETIKALVYVGPFVTL